MRDSISLHRSCSRGTKQDNRPEHSGVSSTGNIDAVQQDSPEGQLGYPVSLPQGRRWTRIYVYRLKRIVSRTGDLAAIKRLALLSWTT